MHVQANLGMNRYNNGIDVPVQPFALPEDYPMADALPTLAGS